MPAPTRSAELTAALRELLSIVSERRRRELQARDQRFRDFADAASDFFWELDDQLRFTYLSGRMPEVAGIPPEQMLGRRADESGVIGLDPEVLESHLAELRARRPFRNLIHSRTLADGRRVHLSISGKPVFDDDGIFRGYRGSGSDVSKRIESERTLELARQRAEEANRAKSEFLALMSHELRTPLNAILGFSEMIEIEALGPIGNASYRGYAHDIRQSGAHLLRLINDILDLSKIESERYSLHRERQRIADVAEEALRMVRSPAAEKAIEMELQIAADCPELNADGTALVRMLTNLLANAVKFTEPGGRIVLRAAAVADGVEIAVEDSGIGIAEADLARAAAGRA
jgi:PAS domain S-box-containing protein